MQFKQQPHINLDTSSASTANSAPPHWHREAQWATVLVASQVAGTCALLIHIGAWQAAGRHNQKQTHKPHNHGDLQCQTALNPSLNQAGPGLAGSDVIQGCPAVGTPPQARSSCINDQGLIGESQWKLCKEEMCFLCHMVDANSAGIMCTHCTHQKSWHPAVRYGTFFRHTQRSCRVDHHQCSCLKSLVWHTP